MLIPKRIKKLNRITNHKSTNKHYIETIQRLLYLGWTKEELHIEHCFSLSDIEEAETGMKKYEEN